MAILKAHFAFYSMFTKVQRSRAGTAKFEFRGLQSFTGTYKGSMVWQFYAKGKKQFSDFY